MGSTRPLPRQSAPGQQGPRARRPRPDRGRRYLKRAAVSLATVIVVLALAFAVGYLTKIQGQRELATPLGLTAGASSSC